MEYKVALCDDDEKIASKIIRYIRVTIIIIYQDGDVNYDYIRESFWKRELCCIL